MTNSVTINLTVFIPSEAVTFSLLGFGGTFNGGVKCDLSPTIDLVSTGRASLHLPTPSWDITKGYDDEDALPVSGKPDWFRSLKSGAEVLEEKRLERTVDNLNATFATPDGATHGVLFTVVGANPLIALAPAIDAEITVGLRMTKGGIEYMVSGGHDGFPSYKLALNRAEVYKHDCVLKGESPSALKPPMDYSVDIGWKLL